MPGVEARAGRRSRGWWAPRGSGEKCTPRRPPLGRTGSLLTLIKAFGPGQLMSDGPNWVQKLRCPTEENNPRSTAGPELVCGAQSTEPSDLEVGTGQTPSFLSLRRKCIVFGKCPVSQDTGGPPLPRISWLSQGISSKPTPAAPDRSRAACPCPVALLQEVALPSHSSSPAPGPQLTPVRPIRCELGLSPGCGAAAGWGGGRGVSPVPSHPGTGRRPGAGRAEGR